MAWGSIIIAPGGQPEGGGAFFHSGHPNRVFTYIRHDPSYLRRRQIEQIDSEELHRFFTTQPHMPFSRMENSGFISPKVPETVTVVMPPELQRFFPLLPRWRPGPQYVVSASDIFNMGTPIQNTLSIEALHFVLSQPQWHEQSGYVFDTSFIDSPQIAEPVIVPGSPEYELLRRRRR